MSLLNDPQLAINWKVYTDWMWNFDIDAEVFFAGHHLEVLRTIELSRRFGRERVLWWCDPIVLKRQYLGVPLHPASFRLNMVIIPLIMGGLDKEKKDDNYEDML